MTKEEYEARNGVGVDHGPSLLDLGTSSQPPFTTIYRKKKHLGPWQLAQVSWLLNMEVFWWPR